MINFRKKVFYYSFLQFANIELYEHNMDFNTLLLTSLVKAILPYGTIVFFIYKILCRR